MHSEAINHDPAATLLQTGHQQPGRPSLGSWLSYGLGSENRNLPAFVVMLSRGSAARPADPLYPRLWGFGFLPSSHQGVSFRSGDEPVLFLGNPPGIHPSDRRRMLDAMTELNRIQAARIPDAEIDTRIAQYEMAFRMQASVPQLTDLSSETDAAFDLYGPDSRTPGTFAANCLLARRLAESGVRFIQLYHRGWDQHYNLPGDLRLQCQDIDQACAGLLRGPQAAAECLKTPWFSGWRIRKNHVHPGASGTRKLRQGPPRPLFLGLAGRRRLSRGYSTGFE
jgi:hypothetical protein